MFRSNINRIKNVIKKRFKKDYITLKKSKYFDPIWYKKTYNVKGNPYLHYLNIGHKLDYNPSPSFSAIKYKLIYEDVRYVNANPVIHFEKYGKYEPTFLSEEFISDDDSKKINDAILKQNKNIELDYNKNTKDLIVFLVPDVDIIGGGVMSINSIATNMKKMTNKDIILCTVPSKRTFFNYSKFKCNFNIYRFEQLFDYFKDLENVTIHIPEIYVYHLLYFCSPVHWEKLKKISNLNINILNQNMDFMPRPRIVNYLKNICKELTITCAHKSYTTPQLRTSYDCSVHWLSTSNMVKYEHKNYSKKENVLLYSPDFHPMKSLILNKIKANFPDLKMIEIKNMTYKQYLKNISNAKWMITFGEGLDGYFVESIRSGTMAFSVFNTTFFNNNYSDVKNIYKSYNAMYDNIIEDIRKYDNSKIYNNMVNKCIDIDKIEYNDKEYLENIKKYYNKDYTYPIKDIQGERDALRKRNPLVSIAVATYNGEKYIEKQIDSLLNINYPNIEIVVSDDHSTDGTIKILKKFGKKINLITNSERGLNSNFINAVNNCHGEFIALCDQDDIWEKDKIDILLNHIDSFDIAFSNVCVVDKDDNYFDSTAMHDAYENSKVFKFHFNDYVKENAVLGCTTLMRSSFVKKYLDIPTDFIYHDWWFVLNAIKNGNGIVYVDEQTIQYRQHGDNTAYNVFNSDKWFDKKIKQNLSLPNYFDLNDSERELLIIDTNYLKVKRVFKKYTPLLLDDFFDSNYLYFKSELIDELIRAIK
ncbi:MAG: glycosyltransferase [Bacilli bacterium]|nr:glycosyltransferase [Bacilli bacterium]